MWYFSFEPFLLINNCLNNNYLIIKLASFQLLKIIPMNFHFQYWLLTLAVLIFTFNKITDKLV